MDHASDDGSRRLELPADGSVIGYFGYGSLVCRATHRTEIVAAVPARLKGWRRYWRARPDMPGFPAALLTVRAEPQAICDGLLVFDRAENLAAVDAREACYRRVELDPDNDLDMTGPLRFGGPVYVYVAEDEIPLHPQPPKILRSYLDAVMLGFLAEHGEEGLARFLAETDCFDVGLHDDAASPIYPRAVALDLFQRSVLDKHLAAAGLFPVAPGGIAG